MPRTRTLLRFLAAAAVLAAGSAVVGRAAGLSTSGHTLGAVSAAVPVCASGSVTVGNTNAGGTISQITLTLTSCAGATDGDALYAVLDDTTSATPSIGDGTCTLTGTPPGCSITMTVTYSAADSYSLEVVARPAATGTTSSSANGLKLVSDYLTLRTCATTAQGPPTTC
jgi:hypothetical protein